MQRHVGGSRSEVRPVDVATITACCDPVLESPLSEAEAADLAGAFRVLADPVRLRLFSLIASSDGGRRASRSTWRASAACSAGGKGLLFRVVSTVNTGTWSPIRSAIRS
jgi:hypothetical protein